ncbi:putative isomerase YbhE [Sodiomyces alkalinus F11]|uniref:Putative isomerase YbhE n=1 Tax=Sodiomyces alkalinus (strain CBS 110278 / VKM F-3762 / F11) TaxID=1314773 RepID=A0A3N2PUH0_SODAK|nr:putative isomerase YbhE [Sodiomyces alkalinus F11]ROT38104.1 putative isomerase YbhE [Sodiomyces alkalinus F11]
MLLVVAAVLPSISGFTINLCTIRANTGHSHPPSCENTKMRPEFGFSVLTAALASAASIPVSATAGKRQDTTSKVLVGAPGQILLASFDGSSFDIVAESSIEGTTASWMAFKEPDLLYAVDENSNQLRLFKACSGLDPSTNELSSEPEIVEGSTGVVHLEFNADKTRLVGSSYSEGQIDIWDISEGTPKLIKNIKSEEELGPHELRPRPFGPLLRRRRPRHRLILLVDSADDAWELVNVARVPTPGCGPRHGAFLPSSEDPTKASHYVVVCELANTVEVFAVTYDDAEAGTGTGTGIDFRPSQPALSTFGRRPTNSSSSAAGAIETSADGRHIYVSNRITGGATDSIAHFRAAPASACFGGLKVEFVGLVPSAGVNPRMFSLAADEDLLFTSNIAAGFGLLALSRDPSDGTLAETPVASVDVETFGPEGFGPQFVLQIA